MSGTARSSARSTASGRIKTENPALVKLLTGDSLTNTRFVESTSPVQSQHASTNVNESQNSPNRREEIPRNTEKNSAKQIEIDNNKNLTDNKTITSRPNSVKGSEQKESRPSSRYSVKSESKLVKEQSKESSWGNVDESLTFDVTNVENSQPITKENTLTLDFNPRITSGSKKPNSEAFQSASIKSGHNTPSKIDYLQVERVESPNFERIRSREDNRTPGGTSQSYSSSRLKNQNTAGKEHPHLEARSASQLFDSQGVGFEGDSLDVDSGLVPDSTSFLVSAPDTGRQTYRVPTPVKSDDVPVIQSPSRYRSNSSASQRSAYSATGVPPPQLDRNQSIVSDNGIPPPSNLNLSGRIPGTEEDIQDSAKPTDLRKSAVSFKEPVITDYHSHTEGRETSDWDTPRVPTPHPSSPPKFHDSIDFGSGRTSNLSPEPTHHSEADIPSVLYTQGDSNNSAKSSRSIKKVYIDSPTFTKEEEEEFRFVESRIDDMNEDLEDTVRRIEEQGNRYRQEREAMNEEAARLRAEIQATEGYSNSYNRNNYSDNHSKPITHPTEEMDQRYGRDQDYRQDGFQNGYSQGYANDRDSRDVYNTRNTRNDRYEDRNVDNSYGRNQERYEQEDYSRNQYSEKQGYGQNRGGYSQNQGGYSQNQGGNSQNQGGYNQDDDSYSRNQGGYSQNQGRYNRDSEMQEQDSYSRRPNNQYNDKYGGQQNNQYYDRRGDSPSRYPQSDNRGDDDLQRETQYQEDLMNRVESNKKLDSEIVIPRIPVTEETYRDSLDDNDQRNYVRDSLDQENYGNWGNPPPNPFGQGRDENAEYLNRPQEKQPDYVDENDTARMELLHPKEPKIDYVEENKFTYGLPPNKTYRTLKIKEKEAEQKLHEVFVTPKKPGNKKHKRTIPLSNEERRPPLTELRENEGGAEDVWAKRSAQLAKHKDGKVTGSGTVKKSRGLQKYPSESAVQSSQGQIYQGQGQGRMYGTPTRNQYLEPLGYKPQLSKEDPQQSPTYREGSYKKPLELQPIKTEITTDDGQKISVDINLKVLSPTLQRRIKSHPDDAPNSGAPFNVHAEVKQNNQGDRRPVGVQYQPGNRDQSGGDIPSRQSPHSQGSRQYPIEENRQYPFDNQDTRSYQDQPQTQQESYRGNDYDGIDEDALRKQEEALMAELNLSPNPYAKIPPIPIRDELSVPMIVEKGGYASMYQDAKNKDPNQQPWYQVYTVKDFKKMQKEVRLSRGTLGPDLDNETYKEKLEKRHKQFEYARMVMEKNKHDLHDKKPPSFPRKDPQIEEAEKSKRRAEKIPADRLKDPYFITSKNLRKAALDYARNVPKPQTKPRPTQYNSYEVASQLSPIAKQGSTGVKSPTHSQQNVDVVDLKKLQQRHEQEKKNVALMRQNMESVPQKA